MTITVSKILEHINNIAPFSLAESWDNNGLIIGSPENEASSVLVALDPSSAVLQEAISKGCDTVITHHPAIFKPLPSINTTTPEGQFIQTALNNSISIIACHTNFDSAVDGVSDVLGRALNLQEMSPIITSSQQQIDTGMGRIGTLKKKLSGNEFIKHTLKALDLPSVQIAGNIPEIVSRVAVCGGSGSDLAVVTKNMGADLLVTSEVKHSIARWAEDAGFCIIDGTHYSTEQFAVDLLAQKLKDTAKENNWQIKIYSTEMEKHPFTTVVRD